MPFPSLSLKSKLGCSLLPLPSIDEFLTTEFGEYYYREGSRTWNCLHKESSRDSETHSAYSAVNSIMISQASPENALKYVLETHFSPLTYLKAPLDTKGLGDEPVSSLKGIIAHTPNGDGGIDTPNERCIFTFDYVKSEEVPQEVLRRIESRARRIASSNSSSKTYGAIFAARSLTLWKYDVTTSTSTSVKGSRSQSARHSLSCTSPLTWSPTQQSEFKGRNHEIITILSRIVLAENHLIGRRDVVTPLEPPTIAEAEAEAGTSSIKLRTIFLALWRNRASFFRIAYKVVKSSWTWGAGLLCRCHVVPDKGYSDALEEALDKRTEENTRRSQC